MELAALLASGALHELSAIYCLMRCLGDKAKKTLEGKRYTNQSKLEGCTSEEVQDLGFMLADVCKNGDCQKQFGWIVPKGAECDRFHFKNPNLPRFFMSIKVPPILVEATRTGLRQLQVLFSRNWCMICDETNFAIGCPSSLIIQSYSSIPSSIVFPLCILSALTFHSKIFVFIDT